MWEWMWNGPNKKNGDQTIDFLAEINTLRLTAWLAGDRDNCQTYLTRYPGYQVHTYLYGVAWAPTNTAQREGWESRGAPDRPTNACVSIPVLRT